MKNGKINKLFVFFKQILLDFPEKVHIIEAKITFFHIFEGLMKKKRLACCFSIDNPLKLYLSRHFEYIMKTVC